MLVVPLPANRPLILEAGAPGAWVERGTVDLFLVPWDGHAPAGARHRLARVEARGWFPSLDPRSFGLPWVVVALGTPDTRIAMLPASAMDAALGSAETLLRQAAHQRLQQWVACWPGVDRNAAPLATLEDLERVHRHGLEAALAGIEQSRQGQRERLQQREASDAWALDQALLGLSAAATLQSPPPREAAANDPLLAACRVVGTASAIEFQAPSPLPAGQTRRDPLGDVLRASHVRGREVALQGAWWTQDHGHLLAFAADDERPLALVCEPSGRGYRVVDPVRGIEQRVDATVAAGLAPRAWMFYRPFGAGTIDLRRLLRFALTGRSRDLQAVAGLAALAALLGLVLPWATGQLIDTVIPHADRSQLGQLAVALVAVTLGISILGLTQSVAQLRVEAKADAAVQSAVWDRLLHLPVPFFRDYTAGDLALRANGISAIRRALSGSALRSVLSALFSLFGLGLMAAQSGPLTLIAGALVLLLVSVTAGVNYLALRHERALSALEGRLSGLLLQLLAGINKVRSAGAEGRAFGRWAERYAELQRCSLEGERLRNLLAVVSGSYPVMTSIVLFAAIGVFQATPALTTGQFLVFTAAFSLLLGSLLSLAQTAVDLLNVVPLYERAKPLLEANPEVDDGKTDPGLLDGRIDLHNLVFAYQPEGPTILKGVSLSIRAGEFVAIVGSSGSGKSTLLRLLLGFERPSQGTISYSDRDLSTLDLQAVRRQLGVVLQNGQLMDGDLFSNIVGSRPLGLADAEAAVRLAGMQGDLAAMPMGLHTVVGDRGSTLSGGQRQRLLIAQAIVHRPRILFLDEATSALDHHTQMHVMQSFEQLDATRVVIAHRLSTIVRADRIVVLQEGRVVEEGRFDELVAQGGVFAQMARRQVA